MKTTAGLWIDHRKAVIMIGTPKGEETLEIKSKVEKQPGRIDGIRSTMPYESQLVKADDSRQREYTVHLTKYFDEVIAAIANAQSILIFGPGEAKRQLQSRFDDTDLGSRSVLVVESADKMTNAQIESKIHRHFHE